MLRIWTACAVLTLLAIVPRPARADTVMLQGSMVVVPLDVFVVTTGATPVTALSAGHRTAGGWLFNPSTTTPLCISETGPAGTVSSGATTCIAAGSTYQLVPSIAPVSVNATDAGHVFSGEGITN